MRRSNLLKLWSMVSLFMVAFGLFPATLHAQWAYVNDNNSGAGTNTAYGFKNTGTTLVPIAGEPALGWPTHGTSIVHTDPLKDQALYKFGSTACLYVSETLPSAGDPRGDIAAFFVEPSNGKLTLIAKYPTPAGIHSQWGIALTTRHSTQPALYAGYSTTGHNIIGVWKILNTKCELQFKSQLAVTPLNGGYIGGMAESPNGRTLVVAYVDGSIESFKTPGYIVSAVGLCAASNSTGFTDGNGGMPAGVDITADSQYAIFGDVTGTSTPHGPVELETIPIPIPASCPATTDYGGSIVASATYLGSNIDSTNVWLSPNESYIYVSSNGPNAPQGFTTVGYTEPAITGLASGCTAGYGNPISLVSPGPGFFEPNGIQTASPSGNGSQVYVGEYRTLAPYSAVALLDVDSAGCTQEVSGSPFHDPNGAGGASQLSAWPPRPF